MTARIRIGVRLPIDGDSAVSARLGELATQAEQLGYHSVWAADHVIIPANITSQYRGAPGGRFPFPPDHSWLEPLTALAWIASITHRIELATGILVLPQRQPIVVAKQAATLAHLCGGRLTLGIGVGWMREEFRLLDADFEHRVERTKEAVARMRRLWAGQDFEGGLMRPLPPGGRIPILWGGYTRPARRCVAELGDGWLSADRAAAEFADAVRELAELAEKCNRDPASLRIVAKPGLGVKVTAELVEEFAMAGATDFVLDPPHTRGSEAVREEMSRVAEVCALEPPD